ncbi:MAG: archaeosortase/exosortase family protein [Nanoarchaeota archaeon]|nr:archaeosortase/exosortase family protein [Nanoarchaeota archaeon]
MKKKFLKNYKENKGLIEFVIRSAIFFGILFGFYFFIFIYFRHTDFFVRYLSVSDKFYFDFLTGLRKSDFINSALFTLAIFVIWNRELFMKMKVFRQVKKETVIFSVLAVLTQIGHYAFKYWIRTHPKEAFANTLMMSLLKYSFNIVFIVFLALAVYNSGIFRYYFHLVKKQIPILAGILVGYFFLIQFFQTVWRFLGNFVAGSVYALLNITFNNAYIRTSSISTPSLGVGDFLVGISKECSGIDSLLLFLSLYTAILVLDWKRLDRKRMYMLLVPGVIGTILYNVLRVYLLLLVGVWISPEFAVDMFHSNIGWILFLVFFMVFWQFGSEWVYVKNMKSKAEKNKKE